MYINKRFALARYNPNGVLDPTFSSDGIVATTFPGTQDAWANAIGIDGSGKIVSAGAIYIPETSYGGRTLFALARYNPDGSLDPSFAGGRIVTDFTQTGYEVINDIAISADGKIVVAGETGAGYGGYSVFALARYNPNGSLDPSFSFDGKLTTDFVDSPRENAHAIAIDANGKIVVAGRAIAGNAIGGQTIIALARYNPSGGLDTSFSFDGLATTKFIGKAQATANDIIIDANGKLVVAINYVTQLTTSTSQSRFMVARYNPNGNRDTTFSQDGTAIINFPNSQDERARAIAIDSGGRILVAGNTFGPAQFALARIKADGSPDLSFSADGRVTTSFPNATGARANAMAIDTNGKIVLAGEAEVGGRSRFALARYHPDGSLDTGFSGDGTATNIFPNSAGSSISDIAIDANGNIVVAGWAADWVEPPPGPH